MVVLRSRINKIVRQMAIDIRNDLFDRLFYQSELLANDILDLYWEKEIIWAAFQGRCENYRKKNEYYRNHFCPKNKRSQWPNNKGERNDHSNNQRRKR